MSSGCMFKKYLLLLFNLCVSVHKCVYVYICVYVCEFEIYMCATETRREC